MFGSYRQPSTPRSVYTGLRVWYVFRYSIRFDLPWHHCPQHLRSTGAFLARCAEEEAEVRSSWSMVRRCGRGRARHGVQPPCAERPPRPGRDRSGSLGVAERYPLQSRRSPSRCRGCYCRCLKAYRCQHARPGCPRRREQSWRAGEGGSEARTLHGLEGTPARRRDEGRDKTGKVQVHT